MQDRVLHKQLLALHASIRGLKEKLQEKENWEWEAMQMHDLVGSPAVVSKVEVLPLTGTSSSRKIFHVKQDSGILSDEEEDSNYEERYDIFPVESPSTLLRTNTFTSPAPVESYYYVSEKLSRAETQKPLSEPPPAKERDITNQRKLRCNSFPEGKASRQLERMPVINETLKKAQKPTFVHGKTFAICGQRKTNKNSTADLVVERDKQPVRMIPAFRPLSRHRSMPVMHQVGTRPRSKTEPSKRVFVEGDRSNSFSQTPIRKVASSLELSHRQSEYREKQMEPYKIYKSVSQISLV